MFTKEQIIKLLSSDRDGFDFVEKTRSRYVLYVFDRDDSFEVRLVQHYVDHFNMKVEELYMEHDFMSKEDQFGNKTIKKMSLLSEITQMLWKHCLLEGDPVNE